MLFSNKTLVNVTKAIVIMIVALAQANTQAMAEDTHTTKPKVLEFYASWAEPCKQLKPAMERARAQFGEDVEFVSYDVDDPAVRDIVEQYEVAPIPTVIFVNSKDEICGYSIGCEGAGEKEDRDLRKGINKILPATNVAKAAVDPAHS